MPSIRLILALTVVVAVALAAFLLGSYGPREKATSTTGPTFDVDLEEWTLGFKELTVPANEQMTFVVRNSGTIAHGFEIEGEIDGEEREWEVEPFQPGQTKTVTVTLPPGEYEAYCPVSGHEAEGMVGVVIAQGD